MRELEGGFNGARCEPEAEDERRSKGGGVAYLWDGIGCVIALLYGLPSLYLPFGRDQSAFWYVGKIWREGGLPYVGAIDHKPPAIYGIYALSQMLFGEGMWAIHLLELMALIPVAYLCVLAAFPEGERPSGALGLSALIISAIYYQSCDFWHTGQVEFWEGACLMLGLVMARKGRAALCGMSIAQACLFKFTAVVPGLLPLGLLLKVAYESGAGPRWQRLVRATVVFLVSGLGVVWIWLLPFALAGSLEALWEAVVLFNIDYAQRDISLQKIYERLFGSAYPIVPALLILWVLVWLRALRRHQKLEVTGLFVLLSLAALSAILQGKFFVYHWLVTIFAVVALTLRLLMVGGGLHGRRSIWVGCLLLALVWFGGSGWYSSQMTYRRHCVRVWNLTIEKSLSRDTFFMPYIGPTYYRPSHVLSAARRIKESMKPGFTLCTENYDPLFFVALNVTCPSPFFAPHLLDPEVVSKRWDSWRDRDIAALAAAPPDIFIRVHIQEEMSIAPPGPDDPYEFLFSLGIYSVMRLRSSPFAR